MTPLPSIPLEFGDHIFLKDSAPDTLLKALMIGRLDNLKEKVLDSRPNITDKNIPSGYTEVKILEEYAKRKHANLKFYVDKDKKHAVVCGRKTAKNDCLIASTIPVVVSGWFEHKPLSMKEKAAVAEMEDLDVYNGNVYERIPCLRELVASDEVVSLILIPSMNMFARRIIRRKERTLNDLIDYIRRQMEANVEEYRKLCDDLEDKQFEMNGLLANSEALDCSDLIELFRSNHNLKLLDCKDDSIHFLVKTRLKSFDPNLWNDRRCDYSHIKNLCNHIFCDNPMFEINTIAHFYISDHIMTTTHYEFGPDGIDRLPNPHLDGYACFGNAGHSIQEEISKGNYVGAIHLCIAYASTLNLVDFAPMSYLIQKLFSSTEKVLYYVAEKRNVSVEEAVVILTYNESVPF